MVTLEAAASDFQRRFHISVEDSIGNRSTVSFKCSQNRSIFIFVFVCLLI